MFFSLFRADGVDDRSSWGEFWFEPVSVRSIAGVRVSGEAAMRLSAVYASVRVLAETMASLPFVLCRRKPDGGRDLITDHWLYQLLARRPNRWQNAFEWREMMQGHLALRGNGFNQIISNGRGEVTELRPLPPDRVRVDMLDSGNYRYLVKQRDGSETVLARGEVFHLRGLSSNGVTGLNPIEIARESVGIGLAAQEFGARFFANDARPLGGWIEYPGTFKDKPARDVFRDSWQNAQSGANRGKMAVLESGMKFHEIGLTNKDSQFIESRQFQVTDIARIFRVPPHLIGDLSKSTNNNIEQQALEFVMYTMTPWAERWEAAIEAELLFDSEDLEVEFDFANLLRGDQAARAEFYTSGINAGWLTRNEARISENLDPIDGLSQPLTPLNMAPADGAPGKDATPPRAPTPADEPPEEEDGADARLDALLRGNAQRLARRIVKSGATDPGLIAEAMAIGLEAAAAWCASWTWCEDADAVATALLRLAHSAAPASADVCTPKPKGNL